MSHSKKHFALTVDDRELATILAALRFHQDENLQVRNIPDQAIKDIATDCGSLEPMNFDEVGKLCERINAGEETNTVKLRNVCQQMLDTLDIGGEQSRQFAKEIVTLKGALKATSTVKEGCPKCGAGSDEREFASRDFLGIEAIHMHYLCKKCGSEIIEEFTLTDVFIDNPTT